MSEKPATEPDLGELLSDLAQRMERVRVLYEQFFMGIEKIEPGVPRKDVGRNMLLLQQQYIRNTRLRFRFNTMLQKWNLYTTYWNRTLREMDNGTYARHIAKLRRDAERTGKELPIEMLKPNARPPSGTFDTKTGSASFRPLAVEARAPDGSAPDPAADESTATLLPRSGTTPLPRSGTTPLPVGRMGTTPLPMPIGATPTRPLSVPPLPMLPDVTEAELRALHQRYSELRRQSGEPGQVKFETLVSSIARQVPRVLEHARGVAFDVALQSGKAVLRVIPKK